MFEILILNGENTGWCFKLATGVEMETFAVFVITFEPIKILTCSSLQNDRLNLSFVKDIKVIGKKRLDMVIKWTFVSCKGHL